MLKRKMQYSALLAALAVIAAAGGAQAQESAAENGTQAQESAAENGAQKSAAEDGAASGYTEIRAQGQEVTVSGEGASAKGTVVSITEGGNYRLSGALEEGQIYVEVGKKEDVTLILDGFSITNSEADAIHIENAQLVTVVLEDGTQNTIENGREVTIDADAEPKSGTAEGAAIYARDDLTIEGTGALTVNGYINNGIHTTNNLTIASGRLQVTAVNNAVKGKDSVTILGGDLSVLSGGDGIQSDDDSGEGYGVVQIENGTIRVECYGDGIYAETKLMVENGAVDVVQSNEGLEANQIEISGGDISVRSADDGLNACGGNGGFGFGRNGGWGFDRNGAAGLGGKDESGSDGNEAAGFEESQAASGEMPNLTITGGTLYVNADGDGLDSNGNITISGGTIIVDGPSSSGNGAIDCGSESGGACVINGGTILAVGSSGMDEGFSEQSGQCSFHYGSNGFQAGDRIVITDAQGNVLMEHEAAKSGASVIFSDPQLAVGESYTLTIGDEETVISQDAVVTTAGGRMGFDRGDLPMGHGPQRRKDMMWPEGFGGEQPEDTTSPEGFGGEQPGDAAQPGKEPEDTTQPEKLDNEQPEDTTSPEGFGGEQPGDAAQPEGLGGEQPEDISPNDFAQNITQGTSGV